MNRLFPSLHNLPIVFTTICPLFHTTVQLFLLFSFNGIRLFAQYRLIEKKQML